MKNELFDNGVVKIEVPEKKKDINIKVDSLTKVVFQIWETINCFKRVTSKGKKDEATINSFNGTSFLNNDEKKLFSS